MFRSRAPRATVVASTAVALMLGLLGSSAALAADNRMVYFGDPATETADPSGDRTLDVTPVTAGGVFTFDVLARNTGNQNLTHAFIGLGSDVAERAGWDTATKPSLPAGSTILSATIDGAPCAIRADLTGALCDVGALGSNDTALASFIVQTANVAQNSWVYASLRVAENVNDVGSNTNSFFADSALPIGPTNSNATSTYKLPNQALTGTTKGLGGVANDIHTTKLEVPGALGGILSIVETDGPTGCNPQCIGQTVSANVRDGDSLAPSYLRWTLEIAYTGQTASKGGILHTLDDGSVVDIRNTKANACSAKKTTDCIELYNINKKTGITTIIFRTLTNGAVRAN